MLWMLWKTRNLWIFKGERRSEKEIVDLALAEWHEFGEIEAIKSPVGCAQPRGALLFEESLLLAAVGCTMIYVSACSRWQDIACFGGVAVDDKGNILKAWDMTRDHISDPVAITLQAIRYAQLVADTNGWKVL